MKQQDPCNGVKVVTSKSWYNWNFNLNMLGFHRMVEHMLKIFQQMLQDLQCVFDNLGTLGIISLTSLHKTFCGTTKKYENKN